MTSESASSPSPSIGAESLPEVIQSQRPQRGEPVNVPEFMDAVADQDAHSRGRATRRTGT